VVDRALVHLLHAVPVGQSVLEMANDDPIPDQDCAGTVDPVGRYVRPQGVSEGSPTRCRSLPVGPGLGVQGGAGGEGGRTGVEIARRVTNRRQFSISGVTVVLEGFGVAFTALWVCLGRTP
jgi:hypothetical protein